MMAQFSYGTLKVLAFWNFRLLCIVKKESEVPCFYFSGHLERLHPAVSGKRGSRQVNFRKQVFAIVQCEAK